MIEPKRDGSPGNSGDARTPDKTLGEIRYARGQDQAQGKTKGKSGAGEPELSDLEPEKQGGIGGP